MNLNWELPQPELSHVAGFYAKSRVLIEYDGPQLVLFGPPGEQQICLFAEPVEANQRWLFADITKLELETLALGSLPMREVFSRKEAIRVVDIDSSGNGARERKLQVSKVPPGLLPARKALLPKFSRDLLLKKLKIRPVPLAQRRIRFDGEPVRQSTIGFSALARLTGNLQALWTAIGSKIGVHEMSQITGVSSTDLLASATAFGSFGVTIQTTNDSAFDRVFADYRRLVTLAYDDTGALMRELPTDDAVHTKLKSFIRTLEDFRVETLVETTTDRVYLGCSGAKVLLNAFKSSGGSAPSRDDTVVQSSLCRGYFDEVGMEDATFVFVNIDDGESISGKVSASLVKSMQEGGRVAAVGTAARYRATIEQRGDSFVLVSFDTLGQAELPLT